MAQPCIEAIFDHATNTISYLVGDPATPGWTRSAVASKRPRPVKSAKVGQRRQGTLQPVAIRPDGSRTCIADPACRRIPSGSPNLVFLPCSVSPGAPPRFRKYATDRPALQCFVQSPKFVNICYAARARTCASMKSKDVRSAPKGSASAWVSGAKHS